ncbi:hypothetical protein SPW_7358 [Streptomyces sp. W007]|uniref:DUF7169 domain-containing protein n=1 Tax=Streptomyces sp. W007 TaxID=1055352 RepID=UPI000241A78D|nr:hypothetical protein [Streptomyces sp. W007]EHM24264.1 hypothetical protein SPW_7358 [Streptomyces sp. W007]
MTYSLEHVKEVQHLTTLVDAIRRDLTEMAHLLTAYDDAVTMPGRTPDVDADGTGRKSDSGPSRPTERTALDEARVALQHELDTGVQHLTRARAYVLGTTAAMDRALALWEGEEPVLSTGESHDRHHWTAEDAG